MNDTRCTTEWTPIEHPEGVRCALDRYPEHETHRSTVGQTFTPPPPAQITPVQRQRGVGRLG